MSNSKVVRSELSKYAQQIENLAREVQTKLVAGDDPIALANELVRNSSTFTFVLGEMYALEQTGKKVKAVTISNPSGTSTSNYRHSKRDTATGRFLPRV